MTGNRDRRAVLAAMLCVPGAAIVGQGVGAARGDRRRIGYSKRYALDARNELVEVPAGDLPIAGSVAADFEKFRRRQRGLEARLSSSAIERALKDDPAVDAGIYPLKVRTFTAQCEGADLDGTARQLTERLGNLRIIDKVPFMRRGNIVFGIRSQGLVDGRTGFTESLDTLFGGGIYWHGTITPTRFEYELVLFKRGRDTFVGRMTETIDLTRKLGEIDPGLYQTEVAYHLDRDSSDRGGRPAIPRRLAAYGSPDQIARVRDCYEASAAFSDAAQRGSDTLEALAGNARVACADVPGKRYYQAYEAWLRGFAYDPAVAR